MILTKWDKIPDKHMLRIISYIQYGFCVRWGEVFGLALFIRKKLRYYVSSLPVIVIKFLNPMDNKQRLKVLKRMNICRKFNYSQLWTFFSIFLFWRMVFWWVLGKYIVTPSVNVNSDEWFSLLCLKKIIRVSYKLLSNKP
jgi:hypothetical protein